MRKNYSINIFINCPFDEKYLALMNAILFTIFYCGYIPRCAKEEQDSGVNRYRKIVKLISDCKHGIHDISRTELDQKNKLPRFNMPFELGLFLGAKELGSQNHKSKNCLVLDKKAFRYQIFLSDIAGSDIRIHGNKIDKVITIIRDWIQSFSQKRLYSGAVIASEYMQFRKYLPKMRKELLGSASKEITYNDYCTLASEWVGAYGQSSKSVKNANAKKPSTPVKKTLRRR